jgi:carboxypeptidase family protein
MRSSLCCLLFAAAAYSQTAALAQKQALASVAGEVRNSITGEPLERAHVVLMRFNSGTQERYGTFAAADGKFAIINIPEGSYSFEVEHAGFVDLSSGAERMVALKSGENREGRKLKLTPTGSITGRVLDSDGQPVEGINVIAEVAGRNERSAATDDRGVFRIGGLRPGRFRVKAQPTNLPFPAEIRTDGTAEAHYSPTYHPDALDSKNALRVEVRPAVELTGIDIHLVRTPILRLSGKVEGKPPDGQSVGLSMQPQGMGTAVRPDGTFEIWRVDPGRYTLSARSFAPGGTQWGSIPVEVEIGQNDVDNVVLRLLEAADVAGQVEFEDEEARHPPQPPQAARVSTNGAAPAAGQQPPAPPARRVMLRNADGSPGSMIPAPAELAEDGTFKFSRMIPGKFRVSLSDSRVYVKSTRVGTTPSEGAVLDLSSGAAGAPVVLHVASARGAVNGTLRDGSGPVGGARVMLVQDTKGPLVQMQRMTKEDGTFSFTLVAPGRYMLFALDERDTGLVYNGQTNQSNLEDFDDIAEKIEIGESETVNRDLKRK